MLIENSARELKTVRHTVKHWKTGGPKDGINYERRRRMCVGSEREGEKEAGGGWGWFGGGCASEEQE